MFATVARAEWVSGDRAIMGTAVRVELWHEDPRKGAHADWGTLIFNYGRKEVPSFLISSALFWLEEYHADGLRVDAVASMLYLDYSREAGEWLPNIYGGNENLDAMEFLRSLNITLYREHPGVLTIAEESTAWPKVSRPTYDGGLGFGFKWNMGWMHDTLDYMSHEPIYRQYHHDQLTFGLMYAFSENFLLPFSHDEVVHGKGAMIDKMPGDTWQRFANLRLLYTYQWTYPGKQLLFMGGEFGQRSEWSVDRQLEWYVLEHGNHRGMQRWVKDLNAMYRAEPALFVDDYSPAGFEWIDAGDAAASVFSLLRKGGGRPVLAVLNLTPVARPRYRIGVPHGGPWEILLNSDDGNYWGSGAGSTGAVEAVDIPMHGRSQSLSLNLPPLGIIFAAPST